MKINIKYNSFWNLQTPITVRSGWTDDREFYTDFCNHAGAYPETFIDEVIDHEGNLVRSEKLRVYKCDKCPAWKYEDDIEWQNP